MRFALNCLTFLLFLKAHASERQKRFLVPAPWPAFEEKLAKIGDYARDLTDSLISQATLNREEPHTKRKHVPAERETEGGEEEVEVFEPEVEPPNPGLFTPFSISFGIYTPWWNGPNTCVERDEIGESEQNSTDSSGFNLGLNFNFESTECRPTESTYICIRKFQTNGMRRTVVITKQCCHGFVRRTDGRPGCSALQMENLVQTVKTLEMNQFASWIDSADMTDRFQTDNFTVFVPSNDAIVDFEDETEDNEISTINAAQSKMDTHSLLKGHVLNGFLNMDLLENDRVLMSLNQQSTIRINRYQLSQEVVTVNCVPVAGKNHFAINGIVHLVGGVLPQPKKTVGEILESEEKYRTFRNLLKEKGLFELLETEDGPWTLFAPTNEAFEKLPPVVRKQIESESNCVESILQQHLVKGTICTSAVTSALKIKNALGNVLELKRDEDEKLRVEGYEIDEVDILGTNGVLHVLDQVLIPSQARNLLRALEKESRQDVLKLIEAADLVTTFQEIQNATFFVPNKESIEKLANETFQDEEYLRKILLHHLVQPYSPVATFTDNKKLTTVNGHDVYIKLHELFPGIVTGATVQCAFIVNHDKQACGTVIHRINRVLVPPKGSIMKALREKDDHEIVIRLLKDTNLERKLDTEGPFTFLAPNDKAFEKLDNDFVQGLIDNKTKAEQVLRHHVLPEMLCCSSVTHSAPFQRQYVRTYDGSILPLHRGMHEMIKFGAARALECDIVATNGLIHSINRVLLPTRSTVNLFGVDFLPFF